MTTETNRVPWQYGAIPVSFMEIFYRSGISGCEYQLIFYLARQTFGWRGENGRPKMEDRISLSRWSEETGLHIRTVRKCLQSLLDKEIFVRAEGYIKTWGWHPRLWKGDTGGAPLNEKGDTESAHLEGTHAPDGAHLETKGDTHGAHLEETPAPHGAPLDDEYAPHGAQSEEVTYAPDGAPHAPGGAHLYAPYGAPQQIQTDTNRQQIGGRDSDPEFVDGTEDHPLSHDPPSNPFDELLTHINRITPRMQRAIAQCLVIGPKARMLIKDLFDAGVTVDTLKRTAEAFQRAVDSGSETWLSSPLRLDQFFNGVYQSYMPETGTQDEGKSITETTDRFFEMLEKGEIHG